MRRALLALCVALLVGVVLVPSAFAAQELAVQDFSTAKYPVVSFRMSIPGSGGQGSSATPKVTITENGESIGSVKVAPLTAAESPSYVVLAIDSSGSMDGAPIADAKAAALRFVDTMDVSSQIAVVSFADEPKVISGFTGDRTALRAAIESIKAGGETAVYDALVTSSKLMPRGGNARRSIVLLSDGTDTVSGASLPAAIDAVKDRTVPVYALALKSKDFNQKALAIIAKGSGGRLVPVERSNQLSGLFEGIAKELGDVWAVSFTSHEADTKDIEVDIKAVAGAKSASTSLSYPNPKFVTLAAPVALTIPQAKDNPIALAAAIVFAFAAVALLIGGVMMLITGRQGRLDRLAYYDQVHAETGSTTESADSASVGSRVVDAVDYVAGKRGITAALRQKLEAAGLPLRPAEYITMHLLAVVGVGFVVQLLTGKIIVSVLAIIFVTIVPILLLNLAIDKRRTAFDEQLPDVLNMLSSSLRGGWGIQQAIDLVVQQVGQPAADEFKRVQTEARLGIPLDEALQRMADRIQSPDFQAAVTAIAIQREVGGNLAEVLDIVAATIRDRGALRRQISALTAEGRLSAYILIALPILEGLALAILNPGYLAILTTTSAGIFLILLAVVLLIVGSIWLFKVTRIEV